MNLHQRALRSSRQTVLPACWLAAALILLLTGQAPAQTVVCKQWRVGQYFRVYQDNGYVVLFQLRQYDHGRLSGRASYASKGKAIYGRVYGGIGNTTFKVRVEWEDNVVGNYFGSPWLVRRLSDGGLAANMRGNTFPESGGSGSAWQTKAPAGEAQPILCSPADTIRQ